MHQNLDEFTDWSRLEWGSAPLLDPVTNLESEDASFPALRVLNNEDGWLVVAEVPGCREEHFQFRIEEGLITLSGLCAAAGPEAAPAALPAFPAAAPFQKTFRVSGAVDGDERQIWYEGGMLFLWLPKRWGA